MDYFRRVSVTSKQFNPAVRPEKTRLEMLLLIPPPRYLGSSRAEILKSLYSKIFFEFNVSYSS